MTNSTQTMSEKPAVFADPVAYLAELGITAELIADSTIPAAA